MRVDNNDDDDDERDRKGARIRRIKFKRNYKRENKS